MFARKALSQYSEYQYVHSVVQHGAFYAVQRSHSPENAIDWLGYNSNEMRNATCVETQTSKDPTQVNLLSIPYTVTLFLPHITEELIIKEI